MTELEKWFHAVTSVSGHVMPRIFMNVDLDKVRLQLKALSEMTEKG